MEAIRSPQPESADSIDVDAVELHLVDPMEGTSRDSEGEYAGYLLQSAEVIELFPNFDSFDDHGEEPAEETGEIDEEAEVERQDTSSETESPETTDAEQLFLRDVDKYPLLNKKQEIELAQRIERGDKAAWEQMVNSNLRLVLSLLGPYLDQGVPKLDLIMDGVIGLGRAAEKFDWHRGNKFSTYAVPWIKQSMQRSIGNKADEIRIPLHIHERLRKIEKIKRQYRNQNDGREPSTEELIALTGLSPDNFDRAMTAKNRKTISLQTRVGDEQDELIDLLPDEESTDPLDIVASTISRDALLKSLKSLQSKGLPPETAVIILEQAGATGKPASQEELATRHGIPINSVRKIQKAALEALATDDELRQVTIDHDLYTPDPTINIGKLNNQGVTEVSQQKRRYREKERQAREQQA